MECVMGKLWSLKHSFLTPQFLIDSFQIPRSYCSVPVSPARCAGTLVEVSIFSMAPGRPPVVPRIQYNLVVRDIWCWRDLSCDLWPHSCTFLSSSVLYCFRAHRPLLQEVAFEKNAGFCQVTFTLFSETHKQSTQIFNPPNQMDPWSLFCLESSFLKCGTWGPLGSCFPGFVFRGKPTTQVMIGVESCLFQ